MRLKSAEWSNADKKPNTGPSDSCDIYALIDLKPSLKDLYFCHYIDCVMHRRILCSRCIHCKCQLDDLSGMCVLHFCRIRNDD